MNYEEKEARKIINDLRKKGMSYLQIEADLRSLEEHYEEEGYTEGVFYLPSEERSLPSFAEDESEVLSEAIRISSEEADKERRASQVWVQQIRSKGLVPVPLESKTPEESDLDSLIAERVRLKEKIEQLKSDNRELRRRLLVADRELRSELLYWEYENEELLRLLSDEYSKDEPPPESFEGWKVQINKQGYIRIWKKIGDKIEWIHIGKKWRTAEVREKIRDKGYDLIDVNNNTDAPLSEEERKAALDKKRAIFEEVLRRMEEDKVKQNVSESE